MENERYYTYQNPENAEQFAHNCLLTSIEQEWASTLEDGPEL